MTETKQRVVARAWEKERKKKTRNGQSSSMTGRYKKGVPYERWQNEPVVQPWLGLRHASGDEPKANDNERKHPCRYNCTFDLNLLALLKIKTRRRRWKGRHGCLDPATTRKDSAQQVRGLKLNIRIKN
jgi:hypothetical protein